MIRNAPREVSEYHICPFFMENKYKSVRVASFCDACVMDESSSITGYFIVCQSVRRNSKGVRDENLFCVWIVILDATFSFHS